MLIIIVVIAFVQLFIYISFSQRRATEWWLMDRLARAGFGSLAFLACCGVLVLLCVETVFVYLTWTWFCIREEFLNVYGFMVVFIYPELTMCS